MNVPERRRILVIKLGALGDFIQSLGPMAAIRRHHTGDHITVLTTKPFERLARTSGYFDDVWIDKRPKWFDLKGWQALRTRLSDAGFSRVYDLQNNDRTALYLKLFSPKPEWVGAARGASHRNTSPDRTKGTAFAGHVQTLEMAGVAPVEIDRLDWMQGRDLAASLPKPYVLIVAGSAPSRPEKRWPSTYYANLCGRLVARRICPVLIGTKSEEKILSAIHAAVPDAVNLCGQTDFFDIPALASKAAGAIGNDTGPMHLIAPTGCKSIILFSKSSNPVRHAPLGQNVITVQKPALADLRVDDVWTLFETQQESPL